MYAGCILTPSLNDDLGKWVRSEGRDSMLKKKCLFTHDGASVRHRGSLSAGEPWIKAEQEPWPYISGYFYAFSFMTADWVTVILQNLSLCRCLSVSV